MRRTSPRIRPLLAILALAIVAALAFGGYYISKYLLSNTAKAQATGDDWPTYMHDGARSGFNAGETKLSPQNAANLKLLWKHKLGNVLAAQPVVQGDSVYIGSWDGFLYALNAKDGTERWRRDLGLTTSKRCAPSTAGITSAAALTDNALFIGGGDSFLYALKPDTGDVLWKFKTGDNSETGGAYNWTSPLVAGDRVYYSSSSFCDKPFPHGETWGLNADTGQQEQHADFIPKDQRGGGLWTSLAVDDSGSFYATVGSGDYYMPHNYSLVRLDKSTLSVQDAWQIPMAEQVFDGDWGTTPTLFRDRDGRQLVGASAKNGYYYAFRADNLAAGPAWKVQMADGGQCPQCGEGDISSSVSAYNTVYAAAGYLSLGEAQKFAGTVRAMDPTTGATRWLHPTNGSVLPALAAANGLVVAAGDDTVEALDAATGKLLWEYATGATIYAAPTIAGGVLYVASNDGYVYAFSAGPYPDKGEAYKVGEVGSNPPGFTPFRAPVPAPKMGGDEQCFGETHYCVRGGFLDYWRANGGLERFGPAITGELAEAGRTVQYFRNAVLEIAADPDEKGAHVGLGKLDYRLFYYTPTNKAFDPADPAPGSTFVPETHHNLSEPFLTYWHIHGEVPGLGYPVSEAFDEYNVGDDATRHVQYFERSRLELVKGVDGKEHVQLGDLGVQRYRQRYGTSP